MADMISGFKLKEVIRPSDPRLSRMENLLIPTNWLNRLYVSNKASEKKIKQVIQDIRVKRQGYHGILKADPQYQGVLDFSTDDGRTFSSPAIDVQGNRSVQIRLSLSQYRVTPPLRAFRLDWYLPDGWVWLDALGTTTYEEAVSNPMVVTRVCRSPVNPQPVGFRVLIKERFV